MKNEIFSGQRFWTYFKYDLVQMWRNHVKAAVDIGLAGLIVYFVVVLFNLTFNGTWQGPGITGRFFTFFLASFALELYYTRIYGYLTDKRKGSAWLMMPASTVEKWVSMLIMACIVLPVLFFLASFLVDGVLCALDPTVGKSMVSVLAGGWQSFVSALTDVNDEYTLTLNVAPLGWGILLSTWANLLYFLLCGICFKRNKILGAFAIAFGLSILSSIFMSSFSLNLVEDMQADNIAMAEANINRIMVWANALSAVLAAALVGGIFWRLKTLKH